MVACFSALKKLMETKIDQELIKKNNIHEGKISLKEKDNIEKEMEFIEKTKIDNKK